jgi:hypothetical protein
MQRPLVNMAELDDPHLQIHKKRAIKDPLQDRPTPYPVLNLVGGGPDLKQPEKYTKQRIYQNNQYKEETESEEYIPHKNITIFDPRMNGIHNRNETHYVPRNNGTIIAQPNPIYFVQEKGKKRIEKPKQFPY